jgi:hypothetical protein
MWRFSKSTKEESPSWGSTNTWQNKLGEVVEKNREEDQTTTPTTHEIIKSRVDGSKGTKDG